MPRQASPLAGNSGTQAVWISCATNSLDLTFNGGFVLMYIGILCCGHQSD